MTYISQRDLEANLRRRLGAAHRVAVVGVGDELNIHDRLGMLAAKEVEGLHLKDVRVFLAGTVPESVTGPVRRYRPDAIVLLDAADLGARPGTVAVVEPDVIHASLLTTHALPLSVVMQFMEADTGVPVLLVGIQPDPKAQESRPTGAEQAGMARLLVSLYHALGDVRHPRARPGRSAARIVRRS